jgi:hypothetical protein
MEALFSSLVAKYGFDVAAKMLGIEKQQQNPKYAISLGNINLNPMNMIQRAGLNQGIKSLMGGNMSSLMGPAALLGGAVMLGRAFDPMRPGSRNYSPNLAGQVDYLSGIGGMIGKNPSSGLMQYGPESVLRGQNVASMFGTNNYQTQLQNYIDKLEAKKAKGYNTIGFGKFKTTNFTEGQQKLLDKALAEKKTFFDKKADIRDKAKVKSAAPTYTPPNIHSGGGGGGNQGQRDAGPGFSGRGTAAEMGSFRRGGIASL